MAALNFIWGTFILRKSKSMSGTLGWWLGYILCMHSPYNGWLIIRFPWTFLSKWPARYHIISMYTYVPQFDVFGWIFRQAYVKEIDSDKTTIAAVRGYTQITKQHAILRWPCAIFADTGVFKIRFTILKSIQYVSFLWDFGQITSNHQSNTKNNI